MTGLHIWAPDGVDEVRPGDDLAGLVTDAFASDPLRDGDVLVVTSKVVSKAEGRVYDGDRDSLLGSETVRVVARRGPTSIVRNRQGLVQAAAGIDASNVEAGRVVALPEDPDASARALRESLAPNVAVIVTDTAGRAWRTGQTDLAIGVAGLMPLEDHAGRRDDYGNDLVVTAPALADEIASAADLVKGKLARRPFAVMRGLEDRVLPRGEHGPGAVALQRPLEEDLFALGAREAVVAALAGEQVDAFGAPAEQSEVVAALGRLGLSAAAAPDAVRLVRPDDRVPALAHAHGWVADGLVLTPRRTP